MSLINFRGMALSFKIFVCTFLCLLGLSYVLLLSSIWIDTEMKLSLIVEGYASFEFMELVEHTFKYLFWFIGTFSITLFLFLQTAWPEKLKQFFTAFVPLLILSDMGSMWLIRYSSFFATQLFISGILLATSFLALFILIQFDLWKDTFKKKSQKIASKKMTAISKKILKIMDAADAPINVKEIDFNLHFDHPIEMIHLSLGRLIRESVIRAETKDFETYMVRRGSKLHKKHECQGTHRRIES